MPASDDRDSAARELSTLSHGEAPAHPTAKMALYIQSLWRYPVKSLGGEALTTATLGMDGITGDRIVRVRGPEGIRTARRHYRLIGLRATLDPNGRPLINGRPWDSAEALALIKSAAGTDAWLEAWNGLDRFDILPVLVATDGAVAVFGHDVRRLRPNIVVRGVEGLAERDWPGGELQIGEAILRLDSLRSRCHMTTIDPDTLQVDPNVLRGIVTRFGNKLALNAEVIRGGRIRVGDPARQSSSSSPSAASSARREHSASGDSSKV